MPQCYHCLMSCFILEHAQGKRGLCGKSRHTCVSIKLSLLYSTTMALSAAMWKYNLMLSFLQSILVPVLHYDHQSWGMHTPAGEAKAAQADLQSIHDTFLNAFVGSSMPLGLYCHCSAGRTGYVTSASLWRQQTLEFTTQLLLQ